LPGAKVLMSVVNFVSRGAVVGRVRHDLQIPADKASAWREVAVARSHALLFTIGKPGILWKLDRKTGKFLDYKETVFQNIFSRIDPKTGEPAYRNEQVRPFRPSIAFVAGATTRRPRT